MQCNDFRALADAYLDEELLVETSHQVLRHLEQCLACRRELAARRALRAQLRHSFNAAPAHQMPPGFETRLRARLGATAAPRRTGFRQGWPFAPAALAACLLLAVFVGWRWLRPSPVAPDTAGVTTAHESYREFENLLTKVSYQAVGDHKECALEHHLTTPPMTLEESAQAFDGAHRGLMQVVSDSLKQHNGSAELVAAHACAWQGRRFAHIILRQKGEIISLLVTDITKAGAFGSDTAETVAQMRCRSLDGYQISCFETPRHLVLVVSALPEQQNLALARSLAPALSQHLAQHEKSA